MMLHGRLRRARLREPPMVPMINIVFLLLLYFMLAGSLNEQSAPLIPPTSTSAERPDPSRIVITASRSGPILIDGQAVSAGSLATELARRIESADADPLVQLAADEASSSLILHQVIKAAQAAGVGRIQLLTRPDL